MLQFEYLINGRTEEARLFHPIHKGLVLLTRAGLVLQNFCGRLREGEGRLGVFHLTWPLGIVARNGERVRKLVKIVPNLIRAIYRSGQF